MRSKVQKWGNSLALRIPKPLAKEAHVSEGTQIELKLKEGSLVITPFPSKPKLKELLMQITEENCHKETDTGDASGSEVW